MYIQYELALSKAIKDKNRKEAYHLLQSEVNGPTAITLLRVNGWNIKIKYSS
jgi:hypothetical protein